MDVNIQKYQAFIKTVECGSFTKAAMALSYSQSGISRMIKDLEREWKVSLLERGRGGVQLTSDGMTLLPYARSVVAEYEKLQVQVDELSGLQSGLIRIGTFSSVATHWLPNIIKEFQKDYPNIGYELLPGEFAQIEDWIVEGRVDCGFLSLPTRTHLDCTFLERDDLVAVLPPGHPLTAYDKVPVVALCEYPFMLLETSENPEISELFARFSLAPQVRFTTIDDHAIMSMVECGLGISVLPKLILRRCPYDIVTRELDVLAFREIGIAVRHRESASLAAKRFMEYLHYR